MQGSEAYSGPTKTENNPRVKELIESQRAFFDSGVTISLKIRRDALMRLRAALIAHEERLLTALKLDLRKPPHEAYASEIAIVISEVDCAIKHLKAWAKPSRRSVPWFVWPAKARVTPRPFGVVLIIGPWNYPVQLLLLPLVGAIAAGNCAILKPSELAPQTSDAVAGLLATAFEPGHVACMAGDQQVARELLEQRFDKIFFTGGTAVGRVVAAAAAVNLTPVTLELGGKCPVIVCADANLRIAARRIIWAKTLNAGQSCVAPDYLLVDRSVRDGLVAEMIKAVREMFGPDVQKSPDFGRIVNQRHFDRLRAYLAEGKILAGGQTDRDDLFIAPTLLDNLQPDASVLGEEIFGPILPVLTFDNLSGAIGTIRKRSAPLAVYLFCSDRTNQVAIERDIRCGGICVNDLMVHLFAKKLPFGGVGDSGMGAYHGRSTFECFSREQSSLRCSTAFDPPFRYPPPRLSLVRLRRVVPWLLRG